MKAELKNYRQAPRKVRLVANLVRGKAIPQALMELQFLGKRAAMPFAKLINSAVANATHNTKASLDGLVVKSISVTKGPTLKRARPRSRGMTNRINKRTSTLKVELGISNKKPKSAKPQAKATK